MKGTKASRGIFQQVLQNVSNLISTSSLEEELQGLKARLQTLNMEKEKSDALLKEKDAQLGRLKKLKEFNPTTSFPLEQALRKGDPSRPRKPYTAYNVWLRDHWNQVKSENPNSTSKEMVVILGAKWKALSAEEKKPYEEKYKAEKEAYLQVLEQEKPEHEALKIFYEEQKQKAALDLLKQYLQYRKDAEVDKNSKREKDSLKPKQPVSAFFAFYKERHATVLAERNDILEVAKFLGREWNNMTKEERAPYEQIAAEAKGHYKQEMELYKQKKTQEASLISREEEEWRKVERQQALWLLRKKKNREILKKTVNEKKQKREKNTDPNRPKKPSSSFVLFSKEMKKNLVQTRPGISSTTIQALICIKWKELGDAEKHIWKDQAACAMVQYKKEMEEYNEKLEQQEKCTVLKDGRVQ